MENTPCAGPSAPRKRHRLSPSPDRAQKRPKAAVMPIPRKADQIIRPLTRENQHIQVAELLVCEHGQHYLIRTGTLVINPKKTQALNLNDPVPVMLPNKIPISNTATILSIELVPAILPNVEDHHHQVLLDLEEEENRILSLRQTVRELERQRSNSRVIRAWTQALQVLDPGMGDKLPQALDYERCASIFIPGYQQPPQPPPQPPRSYASLYRRRLRANRRRRNIQPDPGPLNLPLPVFSDPSETCCKFLGSLIYMSRGRPPRLDRAVQLLVQLLVDNVLGPEQFCQRLEDLLQANAQPYLVRFLTENMRRLRQALYLKLSYLAGIERPRRRVAFPAPEPQLELPEVRLETEYPQTPSAPERPCPFAPSAAKRPRLFAPRGHERERPSPPTAAVAPLQPIPFSHIPYHLPVPMSPIHLWQVMRAGLPALTKTVPNKDDLHLYHPRVGYVHLPAMPGVKSFQIGETTVRVEHTRPAATPPCLYRY